MQSRHIPACLPTLGSKCATGNPMNACTVHRLAEQALLYSVAPPASLEVQRRIWAMAGRAADWRGVVDVVPGMNNLTVIFDGSADVDALERNLKLAWAS